MKSAAQLESPNFDDAPAPAPTPVEDQDTSEATIEPPKILSPRENALKEYVELCNAIKNGRVLEADVPASKSKKSKASSKKTSKVSPEEVSTTSEEPKVKRSRKKASLESPQISANPPADSVPPIAVPPTTSKPTRTRKRSPATDSNPTPQEGAQMDEPTETPSIPLPDLSALPDKWQHSFEMDWTQARTNLEAKLVDYDKELRGIKNFNPFTPLDATNAKFWSSSFDWDSAVNACAAKYIQSAQISKAVLDPSSASNFSKTPVTPSSVTFKPLQREAINMALSGADTLLALATGGGKTMCYVLPALLEVGLTIVISPLISLIQDQVTLLDSMGVSAAGLSGQMAHEELEGLYDQLLLDNCPFKVVYATPERIARNARFMNTLIELKRRGKLQRIVIDEAHCISEWGHDFRKDYRRLSLLKERMPEVPIMAVTGTCTPTVRQDIAEQLNLAFSDSNRSPKAYPQAPPSIHIAEGARISKNRPLNRYYVLQTSFNRPNLWFQVAQKSPETPMADMLYYILNQGLTQECGIIFTMTTNDAERLAEFFAEQGLSTTFYHGGMSPQARQVSHAKWARGEAKLMCTTVAFGMGIDKSNVRYVLHSTMPTSLEAYYQQAGRAGRDGESADCVLFFQYKDRIKLEHVIKLHAHIAQQRQRVSEIYKLKEEAEKKLLSEVRKANKRKSRSKASKESLSAAKAEEDADGALPSDGQAKILRADDFDSEGFDSAMNIVDIIDIPEGESGLARLLRADGSELLFNGFHPDYNSDVSEVVTLEDDPIDAFVRQIKTEKLDDVTSFCREKTTCRRILLMRFFGEKFSKQQCDHTCDICHPSTARVTSKLTRKGKSQWETLKGAREKRKAETVSKPLVPIVAKLHAAIQVQEDEMNREANARSKRADEAEYERQTSRKGRPAVPSRVGQSSPLARKQRKSRFSVLGDPADYEIIREQLEQVEFKPKRKPTSLPPPVTHPLVASLSQAPNDIQEALSRPKTSIVDMIGSLAVKEEKLSSSAPLATGSVDDSDSAPSGLDKLFDSISKVSEAKALRRSAAKNRKMSGGRFSTKRHVTQVEDEDGYIRTQTAFSRDFGSGDAFLDEEPEIVIPRKIIASTAPTHTPAPLSTLRPATPSLEPTEDLRSSKSSGDGNDEMRSTAFDSQKLSEVRDACQLIAQDRGTSAKNVMSQRMMKELVEANPQTVLQLAAVKGIGPRRAQWFAQFLLPIFKE